MAKKEVWSDDRSGPAGKIAGNLVLKALADRFGETISHRKGTTFHSAKRLYVGRFLRADALNPSTNQAQWINLSRRQFAEVTKEALREKRDLFFLLITATPQEVHYWLIPTTVIQRVVGQSDKSCALHVRKQEDQFLMEQEDVTKYHRVLKPNANMAQELSEALSRSKKTKKKSRTADRSGKPQPEQPDDFRLQRIFRHGDDLAVVLPRDVVNRGNVTAGSLVQATMSDGAIQLRPVEVVPRLSNEDARFVDKLYHRRREVFEALGE